MPASKWTSLRRPVYLVAIFLVVVTFYSLGLEPLSRFVKICFEVLLEFRFTISRDLSKIQIFLWTRKNKLQYNNIVIGDSDTLSRGGFNKNDPIKIFIHGFSDQAITSWTRTLKKEYLEHGNYNIIAIDWKPLAESPWYNTASKNSRTVGLVTSKLIQWLIGEGVLWENVHVLGASLGAQAAGYTGMFTKGKIGRITGLDPSGPLFHTVGTVDRLDRSDAQFVDVIHTAGRWVGNDDIQGHVDFFPNGGRAPQPGCADSESLDLSCSHFQSWRFYAESIAAFHVTSNSQFIAIQCNNYIDFKSGLCCRNGQNMAVMGEGTQNSTRGTFFLVTKENTKFALPPKESADCRHVQGGNMSMLPWVGSL